MTKKLGIIYWCLTPLITAFFLIITYRLWNVNFRIPFQYFGDAILTQSFFKGVIENGSIFNNPRLGAPIGLISYDYPGADLFHWTVVWAMSTLIQDSGLLLNMFFLLGFFLTSLSSFYLLIKMRLNPMVSSFLANIYAFLPYHTLRSEAHIFLSAYYLVPFTVLLILRINEDVAPISGAKNVSIRSKLLRYLPLIFFAILTGTGGVYYGFYSCVFLASNLAMSLASRKLFFSRLSKTCIVLVTICTTMILQLLPSILYRSKYGPNLEVGMRQALESEMYGLKLSQLLVPHTDALLNFGESGNQILTKFWSSGFSTSNEGATSSLGVILTCTLASMIIILFSDTSGNNRLKLFTKFSLIGILYGSTGGLSSIFAVYGTPQFRANNRISIFIALFVIIGLGLLCQKILEKSKNNRVTKISMCAILVLANFAQIPRISTANDQYQVDKKFFGMIDTVMKKGEMILQLPYQPFPESPAQNRHQDYDHFRAYLHTENPRYSYGAVKGRHDSWQSRISKLPINQIFEEATKNGFGGILIDAWGFNEKTGELMSTLRKHSIYVWNSDDGRYSLFKIGRVNPETNPTQNINAFENLRLVPGKGFSTFEQSSTQNWIWSTGKESELFVSNSSNISLDVQLTFTYQARIEGNYIINAEINQKMFALRLNNSPQFFQVEINVPPGKTVIKFSTSVPPSINPGDDRPLYFTLVGTKLSLR